MVSWKGGVALAAILAIVVIVVLVTRPHPAPSAPTFIPCGPNNALVLTIQGGGTTFSMERPSTSDLWTVTQPVTGPADDTGAVGLLSAVSSVDILSTLRNPKTATTYGLSPPHDTIVCSTQAGVLYQLTIGSQSFDSSGYYAQRNADRRVYVIDGTGVLTLLDALTTPPLQASPTPLPS
ncbi:MAG: DUF4340 domain-containing protein [Candidatus Dormiibacterota bacterium]